MDKIIAIWLFNSSKDLRSEDKAYRLFPAGRARVTAYLLKVAGASEAHVRAMAALDLRSIAYRDAGCKYPVDCACRDFLALIPLDPALKPCALPPRSPNGAFLPQKAKILHPKTPNSL